MRRLIFVLLLILSFAPTSSFSHEIYGADEEAFDFYAGDSYLEKWLVPQAREAANRLLARSPGSVPALLTDGHVAFFEGRYGYALQQLDLAGVKGWFRELVRTTYEATKGMQSKRSANFLLSWADPRDGIMADDALAGLEAARAALEKSLGYLPPDPVRVEIYPTVADFTSVSTLTRKEVDTTGIIGLCKFDRLMMTTPRATLWGFRWRDTLAHEYVHLVVYRISEGKAPIWVHEGIAKYLEGVWRGRLGGLDPASLALLSSRAAKKTLIPLEKMSPSIAKLDTAEDATLAFAQVATMMDFLVRQKGARSLEALAKGIGGGLSDRQALEKVWGNDFADFERKWRRWVEELPLVEDPVEVVPIELKDGRTDDEGGFDAVSDPAAKDFLRLGDMLRNRGRVQAAAEEYVKAFGLAPSSPLVAARYALGRNATGGYADAVKALEPVLDRYEDMAVLWSRKGDALFGLGRYAEAKAAYGELMEINPFHLPGRMALLEIAEKTGDKAGAEVAAATLKLLMGDETELPAGHGGMMKRKDQ